MRAVVAALLLAAAPLALAQVSLYCHRVYMRPLRGAARGVLRVPWCVRATLAWRGPCSRDAPLARLRTVHRCSQRRYDARNAHAPACAWSLRVRCGVGVRVRVFKYLQPWRVCGATAVSRGLRQTSAR
jgi:hypothetical protein